MIFVWENIIVRIDLIWGSECRYLTMLHDFHQLSFFKDPKKKKVKEVNHIRCCWAITLCTDLVPNMRLWCFCKVAIEFLSSNFKFQPFPWDWKIKDGWMINRYSNERSFVKFHPRWPLWCILKNTNSVKNIWIRPSVCENQEPITRRLPPQTGFGNCIHPFYWYF